MALVIHASKVMAPKVAKRSGRGEPGISWRFVFLVDRMVLKNHFSRRVGSPASGVFQTIYSVFDLNVKVESTTGAPGLCGRAKL